MKQSIQIAAILDKPRQLKDLVEDLAYKRLDNGFGHQLVPSHLKALETSSLEAYISGVVKLDEGHDHVSMLFTSSFLFTCIKEKDKRYKMTWCCSLS